MCSNRTSTKIITFLKQYETPANSAFTDQNFYNCVVDAYNEKNKTSLPYTTNLSDEQLSTITSLYCSGFLKSDEDKIQTVEGIEKIINVKELYLKDNNLTAINISNNLKLEYLAISNNQLISLDVSQNLALSDLRVDQNQLTELDVSNNLLLANLNISVNQLTELNLTNNQLLKTLNMEVSDLNLDHVTFYDESNIESLSIHATNVTNAQLDKFIGLKTLYISSKANYLEELDLSNLSNLEFLDVLAVWGLKTLNLSKNINLKELHLIDNYITSLDLSKNLNLRTLDFRESKILQLDLSKNTNLTTLTFQNDKMTGLDLSKNNKLNTLSIYNGTSLLNLNVNNSSLSRLDLSKCPNLKYVYAENSKLKTIDVSKSVALNFLNVSQNQLTRLDVSKNTSLKQLKVSYNQLSELNVSNNSNLTTLHVYNNDLTNIDLSNNPNLIVVNVSSNNLTSIDLSNNPNLIDVDVSSNNLTSIDTSNNTALSRLKINKNGIDKIDVSNNKELTLLNIGETNISVLNLANQPRLEQLNLVQTKVKKLDLSSNPNLTTLHAGYGSLEYLNVGSNENISLLDIYRNNFYSNLIVYINDVYSIPKETSNLLFPQNTSISISSVKDYWNSGQLNPIIHIMDNKISFSETGNYAFSVNYVHDVNKSSFITSEDSFHINFDVKVIKATSDKYVINREEGYIYTGLDTNSETILSNISLNYGEATIENNKLIIKYGDEVIKEFNIVNLSSEEYDLTKDYIYLGNQELDLTKINVINGEKIIEENKVKFKYNDDVLQEFVIVTYQSEYNLEQGYVNVGVSNLDIEKVTVINGTRVIENNILKIKHQDEILEQFPIISYSSEKYDLTKDYIYTINEEFNLDEVSVVNGTKETVDNQAVIRYNNEMLKAFDLLSIDFGSLEEGNHMILLTGEMPYSDFVNQITTRGIIYKIYNGEEKITSGNINIGMTLKVYYNDKVLDTYEITDEYLEFDPSLNVDEENHLFKKIKEGTKVSEIVNLISTSGTITKLDKNDNELTDEEVIKTGDKIKIELSKETFIYTISVFGDVTGDGIVNIADVGKLYKHVRKTSVMSEACELYAGDIVEGNDIIIADVGKLYKYVRKVIEEI